MKVSILIPAYNEIRTIGQVLDRLQSLPLEFEVVVVDDGSADGTYDFVASAIKEKRYWFPVKLEKHALNSGKGAAIITAIGAASGDILVVQDADLEYDPIHIPLVVAPIAQGRAEVCFGSRMLGGKAGTYSVIYLWGNLFLTWLTNALCGSHYTDSYTCYKAFKKEVIQGLALTSRGFEIEGELSVKLALGGYKYEEVPIAYIPRSRKDGKKINGRDAVKGILTIIRTWWRAKHA